MPTPIRRAYRAFRYMFEREPWMFEVIFGFATSLFFAVLWTAWQTGPAFGSIEVLSLVAGEPFWQAAGVLGGAIQCGLALLSGPRRPFVKWPRWCAAGWLAWLWGAMACASWVAMPWTASAVLYAACSASNLYVAFHVLWEEEYQLLRRARG